MASLPRIVQVELPGITLVGTAHVSKESVREVQETIARVKPAVVAVELDENRRKALVDKATFERTPITDLLRSGKGSFILAQTMLASYQRRMGAKEGVEPGAEMLAAIQSAGAHDAKIALVDRDIGVTLRRAYGLMRLKEKMRLTWELFKGVMGAEDEQEIQVDEMLQEDVLTTMMAEMAAMAPTVANVLIHERDAYLAANIREAAKDGHVVAVLGAGHLKGVEQYLTHPNTIPDTKPLEVIPKRFPWGRVITILISLAILGVFAWSFYTGLRTGNFTDFRHHLIEYVLVMSITCGVGAAIAGGHPLAILAGAVAAPLKILHPFIGSGIFAGLAQAKVREPTVRDLHDMSSIQTMKELFNNRATRVLLVAAGAQLVADIGFFFILPVALKYGIPYVTR